MSSRCRRFALIAAALAGCAAAETRELRVCADPNNLPFSNSRSEGFENKVAEVIARDLHAKLEYVWWAQRKSFVRNSLGAGLCDVIVGLPAAFPSVLETRPWYRSTYVLLSRDAPVKSLEDPVLRKLKIGIHIVGEDYAPPARALARQGIVGNIVGYSLFGRDGEPNPPSKLVSAVARGDVDVAIVWGPFAGYFARRETAPLKMVAVPYEFDIAAAVRPGQDALKAEIERVFDTRRPEILRILDSYGVPLCGWQPGSSSSSR